VPVSFCGIDERSIEQAAAINGLYGGTSKDRSDSPFIANESSMNGHRKRFARSKRAESRQRRS